jgi:hypothetical protein
MATWWNHSIHWDILSHLSSNIIYSFHISFYPKLNYTISTLKNLNLFFFRFLKSWIFLTFFFRPWIFGPLIHGPLPSGVAWHLRRLDRLFGSPQQGARHGGWGVSDTENPWYPWEMTHRNRWFTMV